MTELLTAAQMRAIEKAAIEAGEVTGLELMERAGRGVVDAMLDWRPELATAPHRAVVLCGPGNNGGDGFVVARLLKEREWEVEVFLYGDAMRLPPDARTNFELWRQVGPVISLNEHEGKAGREISDDRVLGGLWEGDVFIDALFGTGLTRPLDGIARAFAEERWDFPGNMWDVAVDAPSGICLDSGRPLGPYLPAELTVTFQRPKVGHYLSESLGRICGELRCVDLGADLRSSSVGRLLNDPAIVRLVGAGAPGKSGRDNKYSHGHALILSGGPGKGGAARLAARGALRIAAGLVTVGCPPAALQENAAALDAVMLAAFREAGELAAFMAERKVKAVCIGPGFGHGERLRAFVAGVLGGVEPRPTGSGGEGEKGGRGVHLTGPAVVLDADAISEYRDDPEVLFGMLHQNCVLTPHEGEFGRLFPDILARLKEPATKGPAYSKVDATRAAAARAGCVVLFKGPDTVIADPAGRCAINSAAYERAAPWLATAGSGDVLAGFITGLAARGLGAFEAAETAAWLHVECAREFGPGLIAEDLPEQLPAVFRALGL